MRLGVSFLLCGTTTRKLGVNFNGAPVGGHHLGEGLPIPLHPKSIGNCFNVDLSITQGQDFVERTPHAWGQSVAKNAGVLPHAMLMGSTIKTTHEFQCDIGTYVGQTEL